MDKQFLIEMLKTDSVSGKEIKLQKKVLKHYRDVIDEQITDLSGNVINIINPYAKTRVLLCGHIDEIGLYVTHITKDGFIKVTQAGGIYPTTYLGHHVMIHSENEDISGVVVNIRELSQQKDLKVKDLTIDIGAKDDKEAAHYVQIGDSVTFDTPINELLDHKLTARAIDDRSGAFIVLEAVKKAQAMGCKIGAYALTSTGEETTSRGAYFASSKIKPNMAIIVDVTYTSDYPGVDASGSGEVKLGQGPVLCQSSIVNQNMNTKLKAIANRLNISYQIETFAGRTFTDADKIHFTNEGVPLCLISLPLRYMHNPAEVCDLRDIQNSIDLIAAFLCEIDETFNLDPFK